MTQPAIHPFIHQILEQKRPDIRLILKKWEDNQVKKKDQTVVRFHKIGSDRGREIRRQYEKEARQGKKVVENIDGGRNWKRV